MKKLNIIIVTALLLVGCNNFDEDININPNVPSQASGTQLIANAMLSLSGLSSSPQGEFMSQYLSETQYVNASLYPQSSTSFYWLYQGPLINLQTVLNSADDLSGTEGPVENQLAVAKILKAYYIWHATDRWGDVPMTDALQGADNFTPKYDTQESIYTSLFGLLDEANAAIVPGSITNDIMYNGDMTKWSKLAGTLKMLMALRLSEVNPTLGKEKFTEALQEGVLDSNSGNLVFKHLADANNQNYWFGQIDLQGREWWAISATLMDKMKPVGDPRLMVYANPNRTDGDYTGLVFGETIDIDTEKYALLGDAIHAQDAPVYLVTYAQALFAQAEAAKLGWIAGGDNAAEENYNMAIEASMEQWGADTSSLPDFMAQPEIAYSSDNAIEQIATQRWVHLFMHGYEGWAEYRRTGYPNNMVAPDGADVPNRQIYIETEQFNNTDNYNEAVQRQFGGSESLYGNIWWDVN
ncbi:SusD/RagB family nutrient-binding outer membrane lipoprotein [Algoriphagus chordae]|uniref:SusD-like starch-binding protein associating with outer membrane n=1 Tax=Algoriphagus chordae TaxID=237019 RepID=A0A2W7R882_9BACT|nr:SusD/RagB family nutrient-binding outer membrane lipoprotein [Algoriphagus chordae]PZX51947.1 SusD-like starch-binding protein associating with outer membrane [Algoriphagus chordae]